MDGIYREVAGGLGEQVMMRNLLWFCASVALAVVGRGSNALADSNDEEVMTLSVNGLGTFGPVNLGVEGARGAGVVIGDGSGLSDYTDNPPSWSAPEGTEFRLNGWLMPPLDEETGITDRHYGSNQTFTSGLKIGREIVWPLVSAENPKDPSMGPIHIMETALGEVHFEYVGSYTLSANSEGGSTVVGRGWFFIVGGTDFFEGADGLVRVVVHNTVPLPPPDVLPTLPPPLAVPFEYNFFGYVAIPKDD